MGLDIILWIGGMFFSLGIFAVKVGVGLGFGKMKWKGTLLTLSIYLALFMLTALLSQRLIGILEPILKQGPYLHLSVAAGLVIWGIYLLLADSKPCHHDRQGKSFLLLLIPCPVCLTAMAFSTATALSVIKQPAWVVGLGVGMVFCILAGLIHFILAFFTGGLLPLSRKLGLGMSMVGIGLYFIASLFLPARIEAAKGIYRSFLAGDTGFRLNDAAGVFGILFAAILIGFFANQNRRYKT